MGTEMVRVAEGEMLWECQMAWDRVRGNRSTSEEVVPVVATVKERDGRITAVPEVMSMGRGGHHAVKSKGKCWDVAQMFKAMGVRVQV